MPHHLDTREPALRYLARKLARAEREVESLRAEAQKASDREHAAIEEMRRARADLRKFVESVQAEATAALDTEAKA